MTDTAVPRTEATDESDLDGTVDFPVLRVEVNVAAAIQMPDGSILGHNLSDATLVFGWNAGKVPTGLDDAQINAALARGVSPVLALVSTALTFNGWAALGQTDEPMVKEAKDTGSVVRSTPVRVELRESNATAIHD